MKGKNKYCKEQFQTVPLIMNKILILFVFLILACQSVFAEENKLSHTDFKFHAQIKSKLNKNNLYQIHLTKEIIQKSEKDLQDIRIIDKQGNFISYVILNNQIPKGQIKTYPLEITEYSQKNNSDILIAKMPEKFSPVSSLELAIDDINFKKNITLYGSRNKKNWELLKKSAIYDFSSSVPLRKTSIEFKKSNFPFYKIELVNDNGLNTKSIKGSAVSEYRINESLQLQYQELNINLTKSFNRDLRINNIMALTETKKEDIIIYDKADLTNLQINLDEKKKSVIVSEAKLPTGKISFIITNPYYSRQIDVFYSETGKKDSYKLLTRDKIYKISLADIKEQKDYIDLTTSKHKFYKFVIENRDNEPLEISKINFKWARKDLYFMSRSDNAEYELFIGNKYVDKPAYDFSNFLTPENWYLQKYIPIQLSNIELNSVFKNSLSPEEKDKMQRMVLIAIVSLTVLILGIWIYKLAGEAAKK